MKLNPIDMDRVRLLALGAIRDVYSEKLRARMYPLLVNLLVSTMKNGRRPTAAELRAADDWARQAVAEGRVVHKFVLSRESQRHLTRLKALLTPFSYETTRVPAEHAERAEWLISRCERMALKDIEAVLEGFQMAWEKHKALAQAEDERALCIAETVISPTGRIWRRIVSKGALGRAGNALHNCCAPRRQYHGVNARMMAQGRAMFWALYEPDDQCVGMAQIDLPIRRLSQAKAAYNRELDKPDDLPALLAHLGKTGVLDQAAILDALSAALRNRH